MDLNNLLFEAANKSIRFSRFDFKGGVNELESTTILLQLILYHYEHDNYPEKEKVKEAIKKLLEDVLHNGYEPAFDNSHNWGYSLLCESFALIKHKEDLWSIFNDEDQARITLLMKMFALMWNFGCNAYNNFATGIGLNGNYGKNSGPNYRLTNNMLIPYIAKFFGELHQVNLFFQYEADYDTIINQLKAFKFKNAYLTWTRPGIELPDGTLSAGARELYSTREHIGSGEPPIKAYRRDIHGNIIYVGQGHGCRPCYHYIPLGSFEEASHCQYSDLIQDVLLDCFNGGEVVSSVYIEDEGEWCKMADEARSPYEGQAGMMKEFNIPDDGMGQRSSIFHCEIDFNLVCACLATFKYLEIEQPVDLPMWDQIKTGMSDFLFKYEHSYQGYSMGRFEPDTQTAQISATTAIWRNYWTTNLLGG